MQVSKWFFQNYFCYCRRRRYCLCSSIYLIIPVIHVNNYVKLKNPKLRTERKKKIACGLIQNETIGLTLTGNITCIAVYFIKYIMWILNRFYFAVRFYSLLSSILRNVLILHIFKLLNGRHMNNLYCPWLQFKSHFFYLIPSLATTKPFE